MAGNALSMEKTELMFGAYCERQSANHVATKVGVSHHTAVKYIRHGDPERNIAPFAERFARVQREITSKTERTVVYSATKVNQATFKHLKLLDSLITQALEKLDGKLKLKDLSLKDVAKAMQTRTMILRELAPLVREKVTTQSSVSGELEGKSTADCAYYAEHGFWPDSADASYVTESILADPSSSTTTSQPLPLKPAAGQAQQQPQSQQSVLVPSPVAAEAATAPAMSSAAQHGDAIGMRSGAEGDPSSGPSDKRAPQQPGPKASPNLPISPTQDNRTLAQRTDQAARLSAAPPKRKFNHFDQSAAPANQGPSTMSEQPHSTTTDDSDKLQQHPNSKPLPGDSVVGACGDEGECGVGDEGCRGLQEGDCLIGESRNRNLRRRERAVSHARDVRPSYQGVDGEVVTVPYPCDGAQPCKFSTVPLRSAPKPSPAEQGPGHREGSGSPHEEGDAEHEREQPPHEGEHEDEGQRSNPEHEHSEEHSSGEPESPESLPGVSVDPFRSFTGS